MSAMGRRMRALERHLGRPGDVTWEEADAAEQRINARILAKLQAMADGREGDEFDATQDTADEEILRRWEEQHGVGEPEPMTDDEVLAQLTRMAAEVSP